MSTHHFLLVLNLDVSWQTSLARSAVSAAEDVRSAVRAARTAENAKAAASAAAYTAQSACDSGAEFPTIDEARAAQTRASIAQSHAFHAAVVEHEAKAVKRRATLALAHDVKCWNVHRKREMLQACIAHARSQHEATRRSVDAWSCLRDGFIGSPVMPTTQTRKAVPASSHRSRNSASSTGAQPAGRKNSSKSSNKKAPSSTPSPVTAKVLGADAFCDLLDMPMPGLASAVAANSATPAPTASSTNVRETSAGITGSGFSSIDNPSTAQLMNESEHEDATATIYPGSPAIVAVDHNELMPQIEAFSLSAAAVTTEEKTSEHSSSESLEKNDAAGIEILSVAAEPIVEATPMATPTATDGSPFANDRNAHSSSSIVRNSSNSEENEIMSASMQSLVEGLMSWGGRFEADDVFALPTGMAASIAFEESDGLNPQSTF